MLVQRSDLPGIGPGLLAMLVQSDQQCDFCLSASVNGCKQVSDNDLRPGNDAEPARRLSTWKPESMA